ncbi:MAG: site-specific integrase [Chloroflexi bacterium]|nr:site-specific integrase [Chloroflexota bacterium]
MIQYRYSVVVDIGHDPTTGKRRQKWIAVKGNKRDAERKRTEILRELDQGVFVEPSRLTLSGYLDKWMRDYVATAVRPSTARGYATIVRRIQKGSLARIRLTALKPMQVQSYYSDLLEEGLSPQTVHHHHALLHGAIGRAQKWDMLSKNVIDKVTSPKVWRPELRILTGDEVQQLLQHVKGTDYYLPIHLALYTGLRRSEICGLYWDDLNPEGNSLRVVRTMVSITGDPAHIGEPKSQRSRRVVAFGPETTELLRDCGAVAGEHGSLVRSQVCARKDGSIILPDVLTRTFNKILKSCGITGVRFHDLRHTHATVLLTSGVPVHVVSARLGHASIQTTVDIYGHVIPASGMEAGMMIEKKLKS